MTIGVVAPGPSLVPSPACSGCDSYPCRCRLDRTIRIEPCVCGGRIIAVDRSDWRAIAVLVDFHQLSTGHSRWAEKVGLR